MTDETDPIPRAIAQEAAAWVVRRDGGLLSPADAARFERWQRDPRHRAALERLESLWGGLDAPVAAPLPPLRKAGRVPARAHAPRPKARSRKIAGAAIAASLALVMGGHFGDWGLRLRADHSTGAGERRTVELADGSTVTLDSRSAVSVDFEPGARKVRLLAGAALFQVAPDAARPFSVLAEGGSVTALGTAFAVREGDGLAHVTVTEHSVRVRGRGGAVVVGEGQRADFSGTRLQGPVPADKGATAWARGRLVVADRPLGEVVAEIARYRRGFITVSGPAAALRVSGVYDLDRPVAAIDSIEKSLGLSSFRLGDRLIVLRR